MKNIKLIIFAILILVSNNVIGQNENDITYKSVSNEEFKGISSSLDKYINDITLSQKNEGFIINAKKVEDNFSSYTIKIKASISQELSSTDKVFREFGNIRVDQDANGNFIYLVGQFKKETLAYEYMSKIVASRYPLASVVEYKKGKVVSPF